MTTIAASFEWVELLDPQTGHTFYVKPTTGECLWEGKPQTSSIQPANPEGDWWELWDDNRQLHYFYHTRTGATEWEKPAADVISLVKAQKTSKQFSAPPANTDLYANKRNSRSLDLGPPPSQDPLRPAIHRSTSDPPAPNNNNANNNKNSTANPTITTASPDSTTTHSSSSTAHVDDDVNKGSGFFQLRIRPPTRKTSVRKEENRRSAFFRSRNSTIDAFAQFTRSRFPSTGETATRNKSGARNSAYRNSLAVSAPINNPEARDAMHPLKEKNLSAVDLSSTPRSDMAPPPPPLPAVNPKDSNNHNGGRIVMPTSLQESINQFAIDGFAQKYFATHKKGLFRRRVPVQEMLEWTKDSLAKPLLMINKDLNKDALKCFKLIQMVMGDRSRPRGTNDIGDIQFILTCGITKGQLRDEIYVQLCKQLTRNPRAESVRKGWEIMCVVCITFPPSKNLESYLEQFVRQHHDDDDAIATISHHVSAKLKRVCIRGAKGKVLTPAEIDRAKVAPFKPSVFGESLDLVMKLQHGDEVLKIPRVVPFLADAVLRANGQHSEGIFRVPGDADDITDLRVQIENGVYNAEAIHDPNVPASLLKYWLRNLADPLIATEYYDACIACAEDADAAIAIINGLPEVNRRIALYMISFLQEFIDPVIVEDTLMNVHNLAMVFAPNFLRCPSDSLTAVFENTKFEQAFLRTLLLELEVDKAACATAEGSVMGRRKPLEEEDEDEDEASDHQSHEDDGDDDHEQDA